MPNINTVNYVIRNIRHELMLICMVLLYMFQFAVRSVLPALFANDYMQIYNIDACGLGIVTSCFYFMYTVMQVPSGIVTDKFGIKRLSIISTVICSIAMTFFYFTKNYIIVCISHLMLGFGASFALLISFKILNEHYEKKYITILTALILSCGALGPVIISPIITKLFSIKTLQSAILIFLIFCYFLTIFNFIIIKYKRNHSIFDTHYDFKKLIKKILLIFSSKQVLLMFFITLFWRTPIVILADLWGAYFLSKLYHIQIAEGMNYSNLMYIGYVCGSFCMSSLAAKLKSFKKPLIVGSFIINIAFGTMVLIHDLPFVVMITLLFIVGFGCGGILTYQAVFFMVPKSVSATASSFINAGAMVCSVILQPLFGYLIKLNWDGVCSNGVAIYSVDNFYYALYWMLGFSLVAILLVFMMKDSYE